MPFTVVVPGTGLPGISCGPDAELAFPPGKSPLAVFVEDEDSWARPPNAVARTTPLTASSTYPFRFERDEESRGGATSAR
ncbi:hypothetical protein FHX82_003038 [Amycolatopsis bartoniae]|uniref:Uncharacterized protein n=1 Tax=Amycolatopsis bartoniae TaxID=941986 RepID=A0A8H9J1C9_9PSEU|nr:hypothetical protein [Amycolatopsis bartoniae]MBB2935984.1 hypothetical protein [Amycolatopsis bartoniae]TVT01124.1 hypothetical protein FNH07_30200 [Amycolatopsis bartoniae]GHF63281.1 hypothetical protein GCM10017566_41120 [Amycolatopsis bartoniae]